MANAKRAKEQIEKLTDIGSLDREAAEEVEKLPASLEAKAPVREELKVALDEFKKAGPAKVRSDLLGEESAKRFKEAATKRIDALSEPVAELCQKIDRARQALDDMLSGITKLRGADDE